MIVYCENRDSVVLLKKARRTFGEYMPNVLFDNLNRAAATSILSILDGEYGEIIAAYWQGEERWTALTTANLSSFGALGLRNLPLTKLRYGYELRGEQGGDAKEFWNLIKFPESEDWIWTPSPRHLSLLLNVLGVVLLKNDANVI